MIDFSSVTNFDYTIFTIMGVSTLFAFFRGFVKSFLYFSGWALSAWAVMEFYPEASLFLAAYTKSKLLINIGSTFVFFVILLIITTLINNRLVSLTQGIRGGVMDRSLGLAFGFARGCVLSCIIFWSLVIISNAANDTKEPKWLEESQSSKLLNHGTNYILSIVATDEKKLKMLEMIDKKHRFNAADKTSLFLENTEQENENAAKEDLLPLDDMHPGKEDNSDINKELEALEE